MTFDSRRLMEMAIGVMRDSISEPRSDGKASPRVGAVLYRPDGSIETACRGELRHGDHAEYTLLERKNRDSKLDGCVLFATLEPCAPGARAHPKLGCAERIVIARIKEVWIGVEDPDPTVDRKGIKFLQDNGVTVQMFDRDLQDIIRQENADFIDQALSRAAAADAEERPKAITLSMLEKTTRAEIRDFSIEAINKYRTTARLDDDVDSVSFHRRLLKQGLLSEEGGQLRPTGFGLLLFGKEPRVAMPQAGLLGTIHHPDGSEEVRDFDSPIVLIPDLVEQWLQDKLPTILDRSRMQRQRTPAIPFELVREAVVNALVHRSYEINGAKCHLVVSDDAIIVKSPGGPIEPITLGQLQSFNAPTLSRNPQLHYVFARMNLAEERGLGMKSFKSRSAELGLPLPKYTFQNPYLILTIYRNPEGAIHELSDEVAKKLKADDLQAWQFIVTQETVTAATLIARLNFDERKAQRTLRKLVEAKLLRRIGKGPATRYERLQLPDES